MLQIVNIYTERRECKTCDCDSSLMELVPHVIGLYKRVILLPLYVYNHLMGVWKTHCHFLQDIELSPSHFTAHFHHPFLKVASSAHYHWGHNTKLWWVCVKGRVQNLTEPGRKLSNLDLTRMKSPQTGPTREENYQILN